LGGIADDHFPGPATVIEERGSAVLHYGYLGA